MVVDDREAVSLFGEAQHCKQEIVAVRSVDPTGAKNEMTGAGVLDGLLARQFACAVNAERRGSIIFCPGLVLAAVEDVIRGVMDKERVSLGGFFGKNAWSESVDGVSLSHIRLGAIDGGVSSGIENDVGCCAANEIPRLIGVGEIDRLAIDSDDGSDIRENPFEFATKLAGVANDQNAGISRRI